ncbi:MAG: hypothetical protein PHS57_09150 [Alphaproteobacteria bacterium]|nr:hypothetical protein [Alphaproteobacteria bacterium]
MSHKSFKFFLEPEIRSDETLAQEILSVLGKGAVQETETQTDAIYYLTTNALNAFLIKVRRYEEKKPEVIFEATQADDETRVSDICVLFPRGGTRDVDVQDLLGKEDCFLKKMRRHFSRPANADVRFYLDNWVRGAAVMRVLEIQAETTVPPSVIGEIISALGLDPAHAVKDSYATLVAHETIGENPASMAMLSELPVPLLDALKACPSVQAPLSGPLIKKGEKSFESYLVTEGNAYIVETGETRGPGTLIGEFSVLDGERSSTVTVSDDFEAKVLPPDLTARLLITPGYSTRYLARRLAQVCASRPGSFPTYGGDSSPRFGPA